MHKISIWFYLILLIAVLSWREVQILIDRGSWKAEDHKKLFWYISWESKWKNFDSFHVSNGFITLLIIWLIRDGLWQPIELYEPIYVVVYWLIWMQIRNLFIKIL